MDKGSNIKDEENELLHLTSRVEKIKEYVLDNLASDLGIMGVSEKFELSVSTLRHIFKKHVGESYGQYVERQRMIKAIRLLKKGKWVKEVIAMTGYKNRGTFNNAFKKRFKFPASHFKK